MKKQIDNIFTAGKKPYRCNKCFTLIMLPEDSPKKCICGFTDLKQLSKKDYDAILKGDKKEVHIVIGVYSGVIEDVEVFKFDKAATEYEKSLCQQYDIPFDKKKREQYYESNGEHEIKHIVTEVQ
jgi:hypothetical protein